ncbi:MAG TPA: CPBP family intramembrane glutamic endopeptidase [Tepidisphaeraceae bacterium]|jgi:hypothetical protein
MSRASSARAASASDAAGSSSKGRQAKGYFQKSELPLHSLVFILPLLIIYEVGKQYYSTDVTAFVWMQDFLRLCGAYGRHLPALGVVGILLSWHIARKDSWQVAPKHLFGMALESVALAIPLFLIGLVASRYLPMMMPTLGRAWAGRVVLSIGAGIYEELVFRLAAFAILSFLLVDVLEVPKGWAGLLMVVTSSLAFSLYHYWGYEPFQLRTFAFRTVAGFYFGAVFAFRGFGISAGSHASYDIIVNTLRCMT